jgi:hypothetical protein
MHIAWYHIAALRIGCRFLRNSLVIVNCRCSIMLPVLQRNSSMLDQCTHVSLQYITCCVLASHYAGAAKHAPSASTSKAAADTTATTAATSSTTQRSISDDVMVTVTEVEGGCGGMDRTVLQRYAYTTLIQSFRTHYNTIITHVTYSKHHVTLRQSA